MSIVFIIPYVPIPRMIKRINTACSVDNTSVVFWDRGTDDSNNIKVPSKVNVYPIKQMANEGQPQKRIGATFRFCKEAFSILRRENPTCIHVTKTDMLLLVWFYCFFRRTKPSVIYEVSDIHRLALNDSRSIQSILIKKILYLFERIGTSVVDKLIVTSESFWQVYYSDMIAKESVLYLPNTPREEFFNSFETKNKGRFRIGFIGKVRYKEQLKLLIEASERADVDVLIAGNGVSLKEMMEYCINKKNVEIYGSYNYEKEIAKLYGKIDCVFSMYDTNIKNVQIALPNRLYEAALCGLPLIVSKDTELAGIVENERIGVAVTDGNMHELTEVLIKLKDDYKYRHKMKENCIGFYEKWKYDVVNQKLIDTYKNLAK